MLHRRNLRHAKGSGLEIGATKRRKGMKIMAIVDRHGLPLSVSTHAANHHEVRLVQLCFDFYMIEAKPENLIGDRAYDSDPLEIARPVPRYGWSFRYTQIKEMQKTPPVRCHIPLSNF